MNQPVGPQFAWTPYPLVFTTSTQIPGGDPIAQRDHLVPEPPAVGDHQRGAPVRAACIIRSHSATDVAIGFSTKHVLPVAQQRHRLRGVEGVRGRDDRGIDLGIGSERLPIRGDPGDRVTIRERASALLTMVRDSDQLVAVGQHAPRVEVLDPSAAEQRDPGHDASIRTVGAYRLAPPRG